MPHTKMARRNAVAKPSAADKRSAFAQPAHQDQDHGQRQGGEERGNSQIVRWRQRLRPQERQNDRVTSDK